VSDYAGPILGAVGAVIGGVIGGPVGAQLGWAIGSTIGGMYSQSQQVIPGPKIGDVAHQTSQEGGFRPIVYGRSHPIAGNIIADGGPVIVTRRERQGKGGPKVETESAYRTYAVGVCEGEATLLQAWRNGILVYDAEDPSMSAENAKFLEYATWYTGRFDQPASPDLEEVYGAGQAPYFRGTAYLSIHNEDVTDQRGAWSQWQFRVFRGAAKSYTTPPYPILISESASYGLTPSSGLLDDIFEQANLPGETAGYGLTPTGGRLRSNVASTTLLPEEVSYLLTPVGGSLRESLVSTDLETSQATYGLTPTGGSLDAALISGDVQPSQATYGLTPTGGILS
jgi:hypothetical protein